MYQVFKNVFFVKGYNRTLLFDSLLNKIHFLPNEYCDLIESNNYIVCDDPSIKGLKDFLLEKELIFKTSENLLNNFPDIQNNIEIPHEITTGIIELSSITASNLYKLNTQELNGNIGQYNIILSEYTCKESLDLFIEFAEENEVDTFEFSICSGFLNSEYFFELMEPLNKIIILNNFANVEITDPSKKINRFVNPIDLMNLHLSLNYLTYFESLNHNVYFNKKIFINEMSEIKNAPEAASGFGYLKDIEVLDLHELKSNTIFNQYWDVSKKSTLVCNICEFRRLCVDNRIPLKADIENTWYYNTDCAYNPYISKWEEEEGYLSLEESGVTVSSKGVIIDSEKLHSINERIWGN